MYKWTVKYEDYDGHQRTEDHWFNLNKAEVLQWMTCNGGYTLDKQLMRLYDTNKAKDIIDIFEDLLRRSYGIKSLDGRKFEKSDELYNDFKSTEAYAIIFTELIGDTGKAAAFVNSIVSDKMLNEVSKMIEDGIDLPELPDEWKSSYSANEVLNENGEVVSRDSLQKKTPAAALTANVTQMPLM